MNISGYNFSGLFTDLSNIKNQSGVYVVLGRGGKVIDVGESSELKHRIENHERQSCWKKEGYAGFAVYYTNQVYRGQIEQKIRREYSPPCGDK